eukprot:TRINITY_DN22224_c0_g1_i1.p1 TRINITY_DN22224_c0_g1~~TRINITY_DN22224_c0_g1_i1.p1  ORF type:complete len:602 (-),score=66.85 TRINITY_DN22224_c0_g1_i1:77-1882(-)
MSVQADVAHPVARARRFHRVEIRWSTLSFLDADFENVYATALSSRLTISIGVLSAATAVVSIILWVSVAADPIFTPHLWYGHVLLFFVSAVMLACSRSEWFRYFLGACGMEALCASFCCVVAAFIVFNNKFYLARIFPDSDTSDIGNETSLFRTFLYLDIFMSVCVCCFPFRWKTSVLAVCCVCLYIVVATVAFDTPDDAGKLNALLVIVVLLCNLILHRQHELAERRLFQLIRHPSFDRVHKEQSLAGRTGQSCDMCNADVRENIAKNFEDVVCANGTDAEHFKSQQLLTLDEFRSNVMIERLLGRGSLGVVSAVWFSNSPAVLRILQFERNLDFQKNAMSRVESFNELQRVSHPNIACLHASYIHADGCVGGMLFDYVEGLSLKSLLQKSLLGKTEQYWMLCDISSALRHLHRRSPCIVHGDVKPSKVIISAPFKDSFQAKLVDVGVASFAQACTQSSEKFRTIFEPSVDVHSFGGLMLAAVPSAPVVAAMAHFPEATRVEDCWQENCLKLATSCQREDVDSRPGAEKVCSEITSWSKESPSTHRPRVRQREGLRGAALKGSILAAGAVGLGLSQAGSVDNESSGSTGQDLGFTSVLPF